MYRVCLVLDSSTTRIAPEITIAYGSLPALCRVLRQSLRTVGLMLLTLFLEST